MQLENVCRIHQELVLVEEVADPGKTWLKHYCDEGSHSLLHLKICNKNGVKIT